MSKKANRLDRWKTLAAAAVVADLGEYIGFALMRFYRGRGMQAAAALTYTTLLALVPLLAIGFAIFTAFPAFETARTAIEATIFENLVPEIAGPVRSYLNSFMQNASKLGAAGIIGLSVSAILLLATIESTFNAIWHVERQRHLLIRFLIFWAVLSLGPILMGLILSTTSDAFGVLRQTWMDVGLDAESLNVGGDVRNHVIAIILQSVGFTLLFMIVPNRSVAWRDALIGGCLSGTAFEILKLGFGWYLTAFPTFQTIYGAMAVIPIFLVWVYFSWTVILLGAVFAASFPDWWHSRQLDAAPELGPARLFSVALSTLAAIREKAGPMEQAALDDVASADAVGQVLERLIAAEFVARIEDGRFVLARDPARFSLYDLYRGLGCAVDAEAPGESEDPASITAVIDALSKSERETLSRPAADILDGLTGEKGGVRELPKIPAVAE
ncbi:YihY family inner membrane protein [Nisaea nitritireducens]|uniref:YihY family inner membrane protein n=1 Tax=Nisaea nitritireducens TaxID=568392 RepID=UPI00186684B6|nr:YihY family inner membrane protein [Nisaea nitritireducens]